MFWYDDLHYIFTQEPNRVAFIADSTDDLSHLPTTTSYGTRQGSDNVSLEPVNPGSVVFIIETSDIYMLNSTDEWIPQPKRGGNSGGTTIETWEPNHSYDAGDLVIYESTLQRCIMPNYDVEFDETKWEAIGSSDGDYGIVDAEEDLPTLFTSADRKMYYSIGDAAFWLWDGTKWELQERSITNEEIDDLFV